MDTFFLYLIKSCGLLLVFLAFYHLLLKSDTTFKKNRGFLMGGIFASAILPAVYFTRKVIVEAVAPTFSFSEGDFPITQTIAEEPSFSGLEILFGIYFLGVVIMVGRLIIQLFSLQKIIRNGIHFKKGGFNCVEITKKIAPFSFLNYIVYNPALYSSSELQNILKHEKIHVSQWHTIDVFMANLNLVYQWFNPFAWRYLKILQQNLEYIADSEAVKEAACKKEYQKTLVKISVANFNPALTNSFYQSFIKKRIVMLNNKSNSANQNWKTALIFPVLLAFLFLFNVKTEAQVNVKNENLSEVSSKRVSGTISKESGESSLNFIKEVFENENIQLDFKDIQRSKEGYITSITIDLLNKSTNTTSNFTKNDPDGIKQFEIYVEDGETGFADVSASAEKGKFSRNIISEVGENPLYIINNKEFTTDELEGKTIAIENYEFLNPENAKEKYGDKAKDGLFLISEGKIIDDVNSEIKEIDKQNKKTKRTFIQVKKGDKPSIWEVSNNPEKKLDGGKVKVTVSSSSSATGDVKGEPIYVLNGELVEKTTVNGIDENSIHDIKVLKGDNAVAIYGNAAKDGAILITSKAFATKMTGKAISSGDKEKTKILLNDNKSVKQKPLIVLNGKEQKKNFDFNSIDPDDIESINVLKGEDAIKKYGKAAKDGVIIISTEKTGNTGASTFHSSKGSQFASNKTRIITITGETDEINATQYGTRSNPATVHYYPEDENEQKPLIVVNGEEKGKTFEMESIVAVDIESVNVLKDESATKKYGDKGENGVIEITLKDKNAKVQPAGTFLVIKATTSDAGLKAIEKQLKERSNLKVIFEKVRRNADGLIKELKVTAKSENEEIVGTFNETDSIDEIYIGLINNKIYISSNAPRN